MKPVGFPGAFAVVVVAGRDPAAAVVVAAVGALDAAALVVAAAAGALDVVTAAGADDWDSDAGPAERPDDEL